MELKIEPASTALVVIDLQRGIAGGPTSPNPAADVVARAAALANAMRAAGGTVVLVRVTPSPDRRDALRPVTDTPAGQSGTPAPDWAELLPEMGPESGDIVITKRQWGAFYGTELDLQLRRRGIGTIILAGISTDVGVESTARDAFERGYQQIFVADAMSARDATDHEVAVTRRFPRMGRVRTTAEVLAAIAAGVAPRN